MKSRHRTLRPLFAVALLLAALLAPASASATATKQVALTFDDGDSELHIRQAVAIAVATQTPITFFPTGRSLRRFPNLWKAIGEAGIPIADHTVTHASLTKGFATKGRVGVTSELGGWLTIAKQYNIPYVKYWRPPGGAWNNDVRSIAGYVDGVSGRRYAVVLLVNGPRAQSSGAAQDALLRWVHSN